MQLKRALRIPILMSGMASLILAMGAALVRLGWEIPLPNYDMLIAHGPLMVSGFLGTLIGLERAVALNYGWTYAGPVLTGIGGFTIALLPESPPGAFLITGGSILLNLAYIPVLKKQLNLSSLCMAGGAVSWVIGNALWLAGWPVYTAVPWWIGFLFLTVTGERVELSRLVGSTRRARTIFLFSLVLFTCGAILTTLGFCFERTALRAVESGAFIFPSPLFDLGSRILGLGLALSGIWMLKWDLARRNLRRPELPRFIGICLIGGFVWLSTSGVLFVWFGHTVSGLPYDAMLHTCFLGFAFSMIFAHAPIIFPAVLGTPIAYTSAFYGHFLLLNLSLLTRVFSDLFYDLPGRQWSALLNASSIVYFLVATAYSVAKGHQTRPAEAHPENSHA